MSGPSRRLFVALEPPPAAVDELARAVAPVREAHPRLRWTAPRSWHLTLAFLGEVEPPAEDALRPLLAAVAARHPAPRVALGGSGSYGDRALWIGIDTEPAPMAALADDVRAAVGASGIELDDRPWHGHLTVARSPGHGVRLGGARGDLAGFRGRRWTAGHVHLVHSTQGSGPVRYLSVASWRLTGARPGTGGSRVTLEG